MAGPVIYLIANPTSGGGRVVRRNLVEKARATLGKIGPVHLCVSEYRGHETVLAKECAARDARAVVVIGGDGTVSRAARGLIESFEHSPVPLAILAAGTGNDFSKSTGAPVHDLARTAATIAEGRTRSIDAGVVDDVPFINSAGFGFDVEVLSNLPSQTFLPRQLRSRARP